MVKKETKVEITNLIRNYITIGTFLWIILTGVVSILVTSYILPKVETMIDTKINEKTLSKLEGELLKKDIEYIKKSVDQILEALKDENDFIVPYDLDDF